MLMINPIELKLACFSNYDDIPHNCSFRCKYASFEALEYATTLVFIGVGGYFYPLSIIGILEKKSTKNSVFSAKYRKLTPLIGHL